MLALIGDGFGIETFVILCDLRVKTCVKNFILDYNSSFALRFV